MEHPGKLISRANKVDGQGPCGQSGGGGSRPVGGSDSGSDLGLGMCGYSVRNRIVTTRCRLRECRVSRASGGGAAWEGQ